MKKIKKTLSTGKKLVKRIAIGLVLVLNVVAMAVGYCLVPNVQAINNTSRYSVSNGSSATNLSQDYRHLAVTDVHMLPLGSTFFYIGQFEGSTSPTGSVPWQLLDYEGNKYGNGLLLYATEPVEQSIFEDTAINYVSRTEDEITKFFDGAVLKTFTHHIDSGENEAQNEGGGEGITPSYASDRKHFSAGLFAQGGELYLGWDCRLSGVGCAQCGTSGTRFYGVKIDTTALGQNSSVKNWYNNSEIYTELSAISNNVNGKYFSIPEYSLLMDSKVTTSALKYINSELIDRRHDTFQNAFGEYITTASYYHDAHNRQQDTFAMDGMDCADLYSSFNYCRTAEKSNSGGPHWNNNCCLGLYQSDTKPADDSSFTLIFDERYTDGSDIWDYHYRHLQETHLCTYQITTPSVKYGWKNRYNTSVAYHIDPNIDMRSHIGLAFTNYLSKATPQGTKTTTEKLFLLDHDDIASYPIYKTSTLSALRSSIDYSTSFGIMACKSILNGNVKIMDEDGKGDDEDIFQNEYARDYDKTPYMQGYYGSYFSALGVENGEVTYLHPEKESGIRPATLITPKDIVYVSSVQNLGKAGDWSKKFTFERNNADTTYGLYVRDKSLGGSVTVEGADFKGLRINYSAGENTHMTVALSDPSGRTYFERIVSISPNTSSSVLIKIPAGVRAELSNYRVSVYLHTQPRVENGVVQTGAVYDDPTKTVEVFGVIPDVTQIKSEKTYEGTVDFKLTEWVSFGSSLSNSALDTVFTSSGTKTYNAGTHTVTLKLNEGYYWENGTRTDYKFTYKINPYKVEATWSNTVLKYNGKSRAPTATYSRHPADRNSSDTINASIKGGQKNVGEYTATASSNNSNYTITNSSCKFYIQQAQVDAKNVTITGTTVTYNGKAQNPTVTINIDGNNFNDVNLHDKDKIINAGTYTRTFSSSNRNYILVPADIVYSFTIEKKPIEVSWDKSTFVYTGLAQAPTPSVNTGIAGETLFLRADRTGRDANQTYETKAVLADGGTAKFSNYELKNNIKTFNIIPYKTEIIWEETTLQYIGYAQAPQAKINTVGADVIPVSVTGKQTEIGGPYKAIASISNTNYEITNGTETEFNIVKRKLTITWKKTEFVYSGEMQVPEPTVDTGVVGLHADYVVQGAMTDVGIHEAFVVIESPYFEYLADQAKTTYQILQKTATIEWGETRLEYNGKLQVPMMIVNTGISKQVEVTIDGHAQYLGDYEATVWTSDPNFVLLNETTIFHIVPKTLVVSWTNTQLPYNGQYQKPTPSVVTGIAGEDYPLVVNESYKDVKNYIVSCEPQDANENFLLTNTQTPFAITPKEIVVAWDTNVLPYSGKVQAPTPSIDTGIGEELPFTVSGGQSEVGVNYQATAKITNPNYVLSNSTILFAITRCSLTVNWSTMSLQYNGLEQSPTPSVDNKIEGVTLSLHVTGAAKDVGDHKVTAHCDNHNFVLTNDSIVFQITARPLEISWVDLTKEYNGEEQICDASIVGGVVEGENLSLSLKSTKYKNVGSYDVEFVIDGETKDNYVATLSNKFVITPKEVTVSWDETPLIYNGLEQAPIATVETGIADETISLRYSKKYTQAGDNYSTVVTGDNSNFTLKNNSCVFKISPLTITAYWSEVTSFTYDGNEHAPQVTIDTGIEGITFLPITSGKQSNAGENYVATVSISDTVNFRISNPTKYFTITPKSLTVNWSDKPLIYNGQTQAPIPSVNTGIGGVPCILTTIVEGGLKINANKDDEDDYKAIATTSNTNFVLTNAECNFRILRKEVDVLWNNFSFIYNAQPCKPNASVNTSIAGITCDIIVSGEQTNAGGPYIATASTANDNFSLNTTTITQPFTISPRSAKVSWGSSDLTYTGEAQVPFAEVITGLDGVACELTFTDGSYGTNVGDYKAYVSTSNSNFNIENTSLSFKIKPCIVNVIWEEKTFFEYNGKIQYPTATVQPLTSGVTCELIYSGQQSQIGTHTVVVKTNDTNFSLNNVMRVYTITQLELTVEWENLLFEYDMTAHAPTASVDTSIAGEDCVITVIGEQVNAGKYTARATISDTNYKLVNAEQTFEITPKKIQVIWNENELIYKGVSQVVSAEAQALSNDVCNISITGAGINVGNYTATAKSLNDNYVLDETTTSHDYKIQPRPITVRWGSEILRYNGQIQHPSATADTGIIGVTCAVTVEGGEIDAGEDYVATAVTTDPNFTLIGKEKPFSIKALQVEVVWGNRVFAYDGNPHVPNAVVETGLPNIECQIIISGEQIEAGENYVATAMSDNVNFELLNTTCTFSISKGALVVEWEDTEFDYNGKFQLPKAKVTLLNGQLGSVTVTLVDATESINVGIYTAVATLEGSTNEVLANSTVIFTIKPITIDVLWESDVVLTYNGTAQVPNATADTGIPDIECKISVSGAEINAGIGYTATASTANPNFILSESTITKTFSIEKRTVEVAWENVSFKYDNREHQPTATVKTGIQGIDCDVTVTGVGINAKKGYTATATTNNANFILENATTLFDIEPKELTVRWIRTTFEYNGQIQEPSVIIETGIYDIICDYYFDGTKSDAGTYPVTIKTNNTNFTFSAESKTMDYEITPKGIYIQWGATDLSYTGSAITPKGEAITGIDNVVCNLEYITESPTINVGNDYSVTAQIVGTNNFTLFNPTISFIIMPKVIQVNWGTLELTYNGIEQAPTATVTDNVLGAVTVSGAQKDNGTYIATATIDNENYEISNASVTYEIRALELTVIWENKTLTYNGKTQAPTASVDEKYASECDLHVLDAQIDAGEGYVATVRTFNPNFILKNDTCTYSIAKLVVDVKWGATDLTYNAKYQLPTAEVVTGIDGIHCSIKITGEARDARDGYIAKAETDDKNFQLNKSSTTFNIKKLGLTVVWENTLELVYNGNIQSPYAFVNTGIGVDCVVKVDGGKTDAGTYTATARIDDANFEIIENKETEFTINKRQVMLEWDKLELTYNNRVQKPTGQVSTGLNGIDCGVTINVKDGEVKDVGEYDVEATLDNPNFTLMDSGIEKFKIIPAVAEVTWKSLTFIYTGSEQAPQITINVGIAGVSNTLCTYEIRGAATDVGDNYTAEAVSTNPNFVLSNNRAVFKITPMEVQLDWTLTNFEYNGKPQKPSAKANPTMSTSVECELLISGEKIDAGEGYVATASVLSPNFVIMAGDETKIFNIAKKEVTVVWSDAELIYNGRAQVPQYSIETGIDSVQCDVQLSGDIDATSAADGYKVTLQSSNPNFIIFSQNAQRNFDIKPKPLIVEWGNTSFIYNGQNQVPVAFVQTGISDMECRIEVTGEQTDAGIYDAYAQTDNGNFRLIDESKRVEFTIAKKRLTVVWGSTTLTYSGELQVPTADVDTGIDGYVCRIIVSGEKIDVGEEYIATATIQADKNFELDTNTATTSFKIQPRTIYIKWDNPTAVYNGQEQKPQGVAIDEDGIEIQDCDIIVENGAIDTGIYTIKGVSTNKNYAVAQDRDSVDFEITPKELTVSWSDETSLEYNATEQAPTPTVSTGIDGVECELLVSGGNKNVSRQAYTVTATTINRNFVLVNNEKKYYIVPKKISVTWTNTEMVYNGLEQVPTASVDDEIYDGDDCPLSVYGKQIVVGEYTAYVSTTSMNYELVYNLETSFKITQKEIAVSWSEEPLYYNGHEQVPTAYADAGIPNMECALIVTGAQVNANKEGETYTATAEPLNANFKLTNTVKTFKILHKELYVVWDETILIYNGDPQRPLASVIADDDGMTCGITISGEKVDAGSHLATATPNNFNFKLINSTYTFTIAPKKVNVEWDENSLITIYNGRSQKPKYTVNVGMIGVEFPIEIDSPQVDAGNYKVTLSALNPNFELINAETSFEIQPRLIEVEWRDTVKPYNGHEQVPTVYVETGIVGVECEVVVKGGGKEVGYYVATAHTENPNFVLNNSRFENFQIIQSNYKPSGLRFEDIIVKEDRNVHSIRAIVDDPDVSIEYELNGKKFEGTSKPGVYEITAIITPADKGLGAYKATATLVILKVFFDAETPEGSMIQAVVESGLDADTDMSIKHTVKGKYKGVSSSRYNESYEVIFTKDGEIVEPEELSFVMYAPVKFNNGYRLYMASNGRAIELVEGQDYEIIEDGAIRVHKAGTYLFVEPDPDLYPAMIILWFAVAAASLSTILMFTMLIIVIKRQKHAKAIVQTMKNMKE